MSLICFLLIVMWMTKDAFKHLIIVGIYMAVGANIPPALMSAGINREVLAVMIPGCLCPHNSVMAGFTIGRESHRQMIGIRGIVILLLMAGITVCRCAAIAVGMTGQTGQHRMSAGQRELSLIVIKSCRRPGRGTVAFRTIMAKTVRDMIRIGYRIIVLLVTGVAIRWRTRISIGVTGDALERQMGAGQRKLCLVVVECSRRPRGCGVTLGTIMVEIIGDVIRVGHGIIVLLVTGIAIGWSTGIAVSMTGNALQRQMGAC